MGTQAKPLSGHQVAFLYDAPTPALTKAAPLILRIGRLLAEKLIYRRIYLELVYLVTALVPSETACWANSPGNKRRTAVWISRLVIFDRLL